MYLSIFRHLLFHTSLTIAEPCLPRKNINPNPKDNVSTNIEKIKNIQNMYSKEIQRGVTF